MKNHELFPGNEDKGPPDVDKIMVCRSENGTTMQSPAGFVPAEEIPDIATLSAKFGGGRYELIARSSSSGKITGRVTYNVAGTPKPLDGSTPAFTMPAQPQAASGGGASPNWLPMLSALVPVVLGYFQMQQQAAAAQQQMMISLMTAKGADTQEHTRAMATMYAAQTQQMGAMFAAVAKGSGGDVGGLEKGLRLGLELMQERGELGGDDDDSPGGLDGIMKLVQDAIKTVTQAKDMVDRGEPLPGAGAIEAHGEVEAEEELTEQAASGAG